MSLRGKTLLMIALVGAVLVVVLYLGTQVILISGFLRLEQDKALVNLNRVLASVQDEIQSLDREVKDWAVWDDTYDFMAADQSDYIQRNLPNDTFENLNLNLVLYLSPEGGLKYGSIYDHTTKVASRPDASWIEAVGGFCRTHLDSSGAISGIFIHQGETLLLAAHEILNSMGEGPSHGVLVFCRYLDDREIAYLSDLTHLTLKRMFPDAPDAPQEIRDLVREDVRRVDHHIIRFDKKSLAAYALLQDLRGSAGVILEVNMERDIYQQGAAAVRYFIISLLVSLGVFILLIIALLERSVLARVSNLSLDVQRIGSYRNLSDRVAVKGKDELSHLARDINSMLTKIENADGELQIYSQQLQDMVEKLKTNEKMLQSIFDSSPDAIIIADSSGMILQCNDETLNLVGTVAKPDIIHRPFLNYVPEREHARFHADLKRLSKTNHIKNLEYPFLRADGSRIIAEISAGVIRDEKDRICRMIFVLRDVTERRQAEQALSMSEQRYRLLFERNLAGVFRSTVDGKIVDCNDALARMLGFEKRQDLISRNARDFYADPVQRDAIIARLRIQGAIPSARVQYKRRDGSFGWAIGNINMIIGDADEPLVLQGTLIDLEESRCDVFLQEETLHS
jgi:PAS domain S-box-containing protein